MITIDSLEVPFNPKRNPRSFAEQLIKEYEELKDRHPEIPHGEYDHWFDRAVACWEKKLYGDSIKLAYCASRYLIAKIELMKRGKSLN